MSRSKITLFLFYFLVTWFAYGYVISLYRLETATFMPVLYLIWAAPILGMPLKNRILQSLIVTGFVGTGLKVLCPGYASVSVFLWILCGIFIPFFVLSAVANLAATINNLIPKRAEAAIIPIIGDVLGCWACFLIPIPGVAKFFWLPLLLDLGCAPILSVWLYVYLCRRGKNA